VESGVGKIPPHDNDAMFGDGTADGATLRRLMFPFSSHSKACRAPVIDRLYNPGSCDDTARMPSKFFKNRRVYLLTSVAYMGSLLFGRIILSP
jgi:hypothetical protein